MREGGAMTVQPAPATHALKRTPLYALHLEMGARMAPTMQTLVSLTETSSPAKWSMLRFSF
jgi:hypothetical protein